MPVFRDGYEICVPTSTAVTGTGSSATINTNGSVTFSACTSLSLNGVFTSTYDNYMIVMRHSRSTSDDYMYGRLRLSGTDNTTASSYTTQQLEAATTIIVSSRTTTTRWYLFGSGSSVRDGGVINLYGPYLVQPTAFRALSADGSGTARLFSAGGTHNQSTSYDGITFENAGGTNSYSGLVCVYGAVQ